MLFLRITSFVLSVWLFLPTASSGGEAPPLRVLILLGSDYSLPASVMETNAIRTTLMTGTSRHLEFFTEALDANRMPLAEYKSDLATFIKRKYRGQGMDVVMVLQPAALDFALRYRDELWPGVPVVFCAMTPAWLRGRELGKDVTGVTTFVDPVGTLKLALHLQPEASRVAVIGGIGELDQMLLEGVRQALHELKPELQVNWIEGLTQEQTLDAVRRLPADSIVLYTSMARDAAGRVYIPREVLQRLVKVSPAPLYGMFDTYFGHGITGGSVQSLEADGRRAASVALRVLNGEPASTIPVQPPEPSLCRVDWRELQRFGLHERLLPAGCSIEFRVPGIWEHYRWQITFAALAILLQAAAIGALLVQRRRRQAAEFTARQQLADLAHAARLATAGELTAAIAHEINQPLSAILSNAEAAELMLATAPLPVEELRNILADIRADDLRAGEVIRRLRGLLGKHAPEMVSLNLNALVTDVLHLLAVEARRRGVELATDLGEIHPVHGDRVQLQQVLLNLILNGMDAMVDTPPAQRWITVRTVANGQGSVVVAVSDTGHGIPAEQLAHVFDSFTTTKSDGMGLGLSIARSIIEAHGGKIRAENNPGGGATLRFTLPANGRKPHNRLKQDHA